MLNKIFSTRALTKPTALFLGLVVGATLLSVTACSTTIDNRDPVGETLPTVASETLEGEVLLLPLNEPSVLLLGYVQDAQFDADRWLIGLLQTNPPVRIFEVPTIPGLFPSMFASRIDGGMRNGIPNEDWGSVATVYGEDAERLVELTGNHRPRNMRVLLLDETGTIRWFHDRGFSASKLLELDEACRQLATPLGK